MNTLTGGWMLPERYYDFTVGSLFLSPSLSYVTDHPSITLVSVLQKKELKIKRGAICTIVIQLNQSEQP